MIELLRISIILIFLLVASYSDFKTRRVSNQFWYAMIGVCYGFILYDFMYGNFIVNLFAFVIVYILALLLWLFGFVGGADAKCYITLSLVHPIGILTIIYNSLVVMMVYPIYFILTGKNLKGYKVPMMIPITVGFIAYLFYGNILL